MTVPTPPVAVQPPPLPTTPPPTYAPVSREVSAGKLVSRSIAVWWRNLLKFGALTLLMLVPALALGGGIAYAAFAASRGGGSLAAGGPTAIVSALLPVLMVVMVLVGVVQMGALTYGAVQHLGGRRVRFGSMLAAGLRRAIPLIGVGILAGAMVLAGMVLLVVPGIVVGCAVAVAIPAVVVERIGPIDAIRRSWQLTRDHRLTIFAAWLVLGAVVFGAQMVMQLGVMVFGSLALVAFPILFVLYLLVASLPTLLPAVAYHDLRAKKEGVATEELVKVFE